LGLLSFEWVTNFYFSRFRALRLVGGVRGSAERIPLGILESP